MHTYKNKFKIKKHTYTHILLFLLFIIMFLQWFNLLSKHVLGKDFISENKFGGEQTDISAKIILTEESQFLIVGETNSKGAGNSDAWIIKLNEQGELLWDKTYGGKENDGAYSIVESEDGGYVICGYTWSKGNGRDDGRVFKIDKNGKLLWDKTFGEKSFDKLFSIIKDKDNNYVLAGRSNSKGAGNSDAWIIKLNEQGELLWDKTYGGKENDGAYSIVESEDGGYVICGYTWSKGNGRDDGWVFKIDKNGKLLWDKTFGAGGSDRLNTIIKADGEGYVTVGFADREHCALCSEQGYIWVIKISDTGNLIWENKNGGSTYDIGNDIIRYKEGYLVVARSNKSSETSFASLFEIDCQGITKNEISLVREKDSYFNSITKTNEDDFFLIVGDTWFESAGSSDLWVIKFRIK
jgi:uncharacterized protein YpmB